MSIPRAKHLQRQDVGLRTNALRGHAPAQPMVVGCAYGMAQCEKVLDASGRGFVDAFHCDLRELFVGGFFFVQRLLEQVGNLAVP